MTGRPRQLVAAPLVAGLLLALAVLPPPGSSAQEGAQPETQAKAKAKARPETKAVTVPFEMLPSNHMAIRARINGQGPYRLVFDVGAPVSLLNRKAAEGSGVTKKGGNSTLFGLPVEGQMETLEVGGLTARGIRVVVFDHPILKALAGFFGRPLDGIVGHNFFARYKLTIDYQARQMSFEPVETEVRDLMKDLQARLAGPKVARKRVLAPKGLWGLTLDPPAEGLDAPGVPIRTVAEGSPAAAAGLKPGDILTTLDGRWTATVNDTFAAASGVPPGRAAEVAVLRDGQELTLTVTPREGL